MNVFNRLPQHIGIIPDGKWGGPAEDGLACALLSTAASSETNSQIQFTRQMTARGPANQYRHRTTQAPARSRPGVTPSGVVSPAAEVMSRYHPTSQIGPVGAANVIRVS
jgi:hypothetical protein